MEALFLMLGPVSW